MSDLAKAIEYAARNTPQECYEPIIKWCESITDEDWRRIARRIIEHRDKAAIGLVPIGEALRVAYHIRTDGHHGTESGWLVHQRQPILGMIDWLLEQEPPVGISPYVRPALERVADGARGLDRRDWNRCFWPSN